MRLDFTPERCKYSIVFKWNGCEGAITTDTNLKYCKRFFLFYTQDDSIRQQLADELNSRAVNELQMAENSRITILH